MSRVARARPALGDPYAGSHPQREDRQRVAVQRFERLPGNRASRCIRAARRRHTRRRRVAAPERGDERLAPRSEHGQQHDALGARRERPPERGPVDRPGVERAQPGRRRPAPRRGPSRSVPVNLCWCWAPVCSRRAGPSPRSPWRRDSRGSQRAPRARAESTRAGDRASMLLEEHDRQGQHQQNPGDARDRGQAAESRGQCPSLSARGVHRSDRQREEQRLGVHGREEERQRGQRHQQHRHVGRAVTELELGEPVQQDQRDRERDRGDCDAGERSRTRAGTPAPG